MRLLYVRLRNYIGIYNGLGLNEIYIDFTKCINNITIIKGDNGSGKSTLFKALTPISDGTENFIPKLSASKLIAYMDDNGMVIEIEYFHDAKEDGSRASAKGYFRIIANGEKVELNPGGNITECKELLYEYFNLDANFMALSQLSSDDRGLADKKPADRKKFINSIINALTVYNNMYKALSKRSTIFRSMINSLTTKIDSLGNEESIAGTLQSLQSRIVELNTQKDSLLMDIATNTQKIANYDPSGSIMQEYKTIVKEIPELDIYITNLNDILKNHGIGKISNDDIHALELETSNLEGEYKVIEERYSSVEQTISSIKSDIISKDLKIKSLYDQGIYTDTKERLEQYTKQREEIVTAFKELGFENYSHISETEYVLALNTIEEFDNSIACIRDTYTYNTICIALSDLAPSDTLNRLERNLVVLKDEEESYRNTLTDQEMKIDRCKSYDAIPENCNNKSTCPFINDLVKTKELIMSDKALDELRANIKIAAHKIQIISDGIESQTQIENCKKEIRDAIKTPMSIINILLKFPNTKQYFTDKFSMLNILNKNQPFKCLNVNKYREYTNFITVITTLNNNIITLKNDMIKFSSKSAVVESLQSEIEELNSKVKQYELLRTEVSRKFRKWGQDLYDMKIKLNTYKSCLETSKKLDILLETKKEKSARLLEINEIAEKINGLQLKIQASTTTANDIIRNILPSMTEDRDKLNHHLKLIKEYSQELAQYQLNYDKVETFKFYTSPTTGIQTIFIESYMNKIISMANELLALLFRGEYVLHPFIVNETEFRIPCSGNGLGNDDISSMSTSQVCMISMILSFALLYHSSTKYNILKLDEIDGGLDTINRLNFITLLNKLMGMLNCQQCIMISHNSELNLDDADVIVLRNSDPAKVNGNIIFQY